MADVVIRWLQPLLRRLRLDGPLRRNRPAVRHAPTLRLLLTGHVPHALDVPGRLDQGQVLLVGSKADRPDWLALQCPCDTGHQLLLNLSPSRRPLWVVTSDMGTTLHLRPSVDSLSPAGRCHFWVRDGAVSWVQPPASPDRRTAHDRSRRPR